MTETIYVLVLEDIPSFFRETIEGEIGDLLKEALPEYDFVFEQVKTKPELLQINVNTSFTFYMLDIDIKGQNGINMALHFMALNEVRVPCIVMSGQALVNLKKVKQKYDKDHGHVLKYYFRKQDIGKIVAAIKEIMRRGQCNECDILDATFKKHGTMWTDEMSDADLQVMRDTGMSDKDGKGTLPEFFTPQSLIGAMRTEMSSEIPDEERIESVRRALNKELAKLASPTHEFKTDNTETADNDAPAEDEEPSKD